MYQSIAFVRSTWTIHLWDDKKGYTSFPYRPYAYKLAANGRYQTLYGQRVEKVTRYPKEEADNGQYFETDIKPEHRVLIDLYKDTDDVPDSHRAVNIDIETEIGVGFPIPEQANNKITAIALSDWARNRFKHSYVLDPDGLIKDKETSTVSLKSFRTEEELLMNFLQLYLEIAPTIITGWNIDFFDIPYIYNRLVKVLGHKYACMLSPINIVEYEEFSKRWKIYGVACLDYLPLYRKYSYKEHSSYNLDAIANVELGHGKIKYEGTLDTLYKQDINKFVDYNINDVVLVDEIDEKLKYIDLVIAICHKCHVPYEDIFMQSHCLEGALLTYMKRNDIIAPNKKKNMKKQKIMGAYVKDPKLAKKLGRHEWIFDLDAQSLYPSVIMSLNISPDTKVGKIDDFDSQDFIKGVERNYELTVNTARKTNKSVIVYKTTAFKQWLTDKNLSIAANGTVYRMDKVGIIPALLDTWFKERVEFRKKAKTAGQEGNDEVFKYYDKRQLVQKILLNSMYGVLGLSTFRFFDIDNAEAVTSTGQQVIKFAQSVGNDYYSKTLNHKFDYCIYVDTDSLFFPAMPLIQHANQGPIDMENHDFLIAETNKVVDEVQKQINGSFAAYSKKYHNIDTHQFLFKQELVARAGFWVAKKRYALWIIYNNGLKVDELLIKGIDVVRSNFATIFRTFMSSVLKKLLDNASKAHIDEFTNDFKKRLQDVPLQEIAKPTGVKEISKYKAEGLKFKKGSPAHVKAALTYNYLLKYFDCGQDFAPIRDREKIKWLYLKPNRLNLKALAFKGYDDPPQIMEFLREWVDFDFVFAKDVQKKLDTFYKAMSWSTIPVNEVANQFFTFE